MTDVFSGGEARIIDSGYRKYDGPRTGVRGAVAAVITHSIQRALGMRRSGWAKALPIFTVGIAYLPAVALVGFLAILPRKDTADVLLPTYGEYYFFVIAAIIVFMAIIAPEVLCTDRRTGMLGVYLAAPLDRDTYLLGKAIAIAATLSIVCIGPPLFMLIANVLQSSGPEGLGEILLTLLRVIGAGLAVTFLFTGITMGVASLTDRKAVAAAAIVILVLVSLTMTGSLDDSGASTGIYTLAPTLLGMEVAGRVHGEYPPIMTGTPSATVWLAWLAWTLGGLAVARYRLHHLPVTR